MSNTSRARTIVPLVLCLAAAAAAWADVSVVLRAPLGFWLMALVPGWIATRVLLRYETVRAEERWTVALLLSVPITILARIAMTLIGLSGDAFVILWALVCGLASVLVPAPAARNGRPDTAAWLIALGLALAIVFPAAVNPIVLSRADAMFHAQVVHEILPRTFPAMHPAYYGIPLTYPWAFHVWAAALVEAMGTTSYTVFFWINGAMMAGLSLGLYRLASLYWPSRLAHRLAGPVVVLGMNALGWLTYTAYSVLSAFVGEKRGVAEIAGAFDTLLGNPTTNSVTSGLILRGPHVLSSFLYKYLGANTLAASLTLVVGAFLMASIYLRENGRGRLVALGLTVVSAAVIHPLIGLPAGGALVAGSLVAGLAPSMRRRSVAVGAVALPALVAAAAIFGLMARESLGVGEKATIHFHTANLSGLVQGLFVVTVPALWGWRAVRRREPALAGFGAGFGLALVAAAVLVDFAGTGEIYIVYPAYLGVAFFAAGGVAAAITALREKRRAALAWVAAALVFLPSSLLLIQGFARDSRGPGSHGYPETPDEIRVFDYLRDETPADAVVVDSQVSHLPPCAAYSGRRAYYGGYSWAEFAGYAVEHMERRERAVVNLFFEPGVSSATWSSFSAVGKPLYVVARNAAPDGTHLRALPDEPIADVIAKLESFPEFLEPVVKTPTIVVFKYRGGT